MRIIIATPLYPPDVALAAEYAKELARQLSATHTVHVLAYGTIPEELPGVTVTAIPKYLPAIVRVALFTATLIARSFSTDRIVCINGHSVEVPMLFVSLLERPILIYADEDAERRAASSGFRRVTLKAAGRVAHASLREIPKPRPEIIPLSPRPEAALKKHQEAWAAHLAHLTQHLS